MKLWKVLLVTVGIFFVAGATGIFTAPTTTTYVTSTEEPTVSVSDFRLPPTVTRWRTP